MYCPGNLILAADAYKSVTVLLSRSRVVRKAWESDKISEKWAESAWAKRMEMKQRRQGLNDFDRFKLYKAKSARNKILAKAVNIKKNKLAKAGKL